MSSFRAFYLRVSGISRGLKSTEADKYLKKIRLKSGVSCGKVLRVLRIAVAVVAAGVISRQTEETKEGRTNQTHHHHRLHQPFTLKMEPHYLQFSGITHYC